MKTLKFRPSLVETILSGEKTSTWRLFDDKDLQEEDIVEFLNWETGKKFADAKIEKITLSSLGNLTDKDWEGHERFENDEEMYKTYKSYYGKEVDSETELKILKFSLIK